MRTPVHVGNVTLIMDGPVGSPETSILLGRKRPKNKMDGRRRRKIVGSGRFVPPGGGTNPTDKSQKHAAQREVLEETGMFFPLRAFRKVAVLRNYNDNSPIPFWLVHIYLVICKKRVDRPLANKEYTEMLWFRTSDIPFEKMLPSDIYWIPRILQGQKLLISIWSLDSPDKITEKQVQEICSFN